MPGRRSTLILAMLAALVLAPSSMSAAQPDQLTSGDAQPIIGETATSFVLSVRYTSTSGNPAQSVTAVVAGQTVPLALVAGNAVDGTWRAATSLPTGTWIVTFRATTASGQQPPPTYGALTVADDQASALPHASGNPGGSGDDPGSSGEAAPQPTTTPRPSHAAPHRRAARPSSSPAPAVTAGGGRGTHERPRPRRSSATEPSPTPEAMPGGGRAAPPPASEEQANPQPLWLLLVSGIAAVGAVAMVGTGWLLAAARREREAAAEASDGSDADPAVRAIPTVEQRALRRARLRQSDDPILAGLGLEDERPRSGPPAATKAASPKPRRGGRRLR
jgi:hypothetical protein